MLLGEEEEIIWLLYILNQLFCANMCSGDGFPDARSTVAKLRFLHAADCAAPVRWANQEVNTTGQAL